MGTALAVAGAALAYVVARRPLAAARCINRIFDDGGVPQWRLDKLNAAIKGDMKPELKAYLWVLQNPNISAVISDITSSEMARENLAIAGRKVDLGRL